MDNKNIEYFWKIPLDNPVEWPDDVENLNLRINRYTLWIEEKGKQKAVYFTVDRKTKSPDFFVGSDLSDYHESFDKSLWRKFDFSAFISDYYNSLAALNVKTNNLELQTTWRLIVGLGHESVYETSLTLHHIYGIPYIPGSAVKGVVRSFIIQEVFDNEEEKALKGDNEESKTFIEIFGTQEQEGKVIFFDAFPTAEPSIEPDVMNVHYPDYYSGNKTPTDYQNPTPIYFLAVKGKFKFVLAAREGEISKYKINPPANYQPAEGNQQEKGAIMWWLYEALYHHGIGAKTAVGYGRFKAE